MNYSFKEFTEEDVNSFLRIWNERISLWEKEDERKDYWEEILNKEII